MPPERGSHRVDTRMPGSPGAGQSGTTTDSAIRLRGGAFSHAGPKCPAYGMPKGKRVAIAARSQIGSASGTAARSSGVVGEGAIPENEADGAAVDRGDSPIWQTSEGRYWEIQLIYSPTRDGKPWAIGVSEIEGDGLSKKSSRKRARARAAVKRDRWGTRASWRNKSPTEKQLKVLGMASEKASADGLTRGEASDLISELTRSDRHALKAGHREKVDQDGQRLGKLAR